MKICVIAPVVLNGPPQDSVKEFFRAKRYDCQTEMVFIDQGPESIESEYEEVLAASDVVLKALEASKNGFDAIVVSCMLDPGVEQARELLNIPVLGPGQTSMHIASLLGEKFSVITVVNSLIGPIYKRAQMYGLSKHLTSVRSINIPVLDLEKDRDVSQLIINESISAINEDNASVIVFGCTGMAGMANAVQEALHRKGYNVPVIDPGVTALKVAEAMVDLKIHQSKLSYPTPKKIIEPKFQELLKLTQKKQTNMENGQVKKTYKSVILTPELKNQILDKAISKITSMSRLDNLINMEFIDQGPESIGSRFDIMLASANILKSAKRVEKDGNRSLIINSMTDPALDATREILNIPVLGIANTVLHFASLLAIKFSIIVSEKRTISIIKELINLYGFQDKVTSIRSIDQIITLKELSKDGSEKKLYRAMTKLMKIDGAEAIIFDYYGNLRFLEIGGSEEILCKKDILILDPLIATLKLCEVLVDLNLLHSKFRYANPPSKVIKGF